MNCLRGKARLFVLLFILTATLAVFAGPPLSSKEARKTIASIPGFEFDPKLVRIKSIEPPGSTGGGGAIVESQFNATFRLEKKGEWRVAEVRLGDGRWEDMELIVTAVRNEKIKRTRDNLQALATAIAAFQRDQGYYPRALNIAELTDQLAPRYINSVIRTDHWFKEFIYSSDGASYRLQSLGPDSKANTGDEITLENGTLKAQ